MFSLISYLFNIKKIWHMRFGIKTKKLAKVSILITYNTAQVMSESVYIPLDLLARDLRLHCQLKHV